MKLKSYYQIGFHLPYDKNITIEAFNFGIPDADTKLEWKVEGNIQLPLNCTTPFKASLAGGLGNFKFLGTKIDGELSGGLEAERADPCGFETPHGFAGLKIEATKNIVRKPVLVMVTYINAAVGATIDQIVTVLHIEEYIGKLGEFFIDGKVHFDPRTKIDFLNQSPYFQFRDFEVGGGLGVEGGFRADIGVLEAKVWVGADGSIKFIRLGPVAWPPLDNWQFDSITLSGEVGAKFRVGWFEREAKGEVKWVYPPTAQNLLAAVDNLATSNWRLIDHTTTPGYAVFGAKPGAKPGVNQAFSRNVFEQGDARLSASTTFSSVLVSNIYPYPEPSLAINPASNDGLLLWVHDVLTKPVGQSQEIAFSRWNGSTWSTPSQVTNDNQLDGDPQVAWANAGSAVAVWERLNDILPISATWDVTTAQKIEVATAVFSSTTGLWSNVALLTNNTALDLKPELARNSSGNLLATWRQNDNGLAGGTVTQTDRIAYAFFDAGSWGMPATAVDNIPGLVDLAAGNGNSAATLAYTQHFTPTGYPTPTLQLFTSTWNGSNWSAPIQRTDDNLGHHNPQIVYNALNQPSVIWLAGNELRLQNLSTSSMVTLTLDSGTAIDQFRIVQNASGSIVAVMAVQTAQRDLYAAYYDQVHNVWGKPLPLTNDPASEAYPTVGLDSAGRLLMAYASTASTSVTKTTTISGTGEIVTYTLPTEGNTDLITLAHEFTSTVRLADLAVSNNHPAPGAAITLTVNLENSGDLAVDGPTVSFYDGDPSIGGTLISTATLPIPLAGGFTATLTTPYTVPLTGTVRGLYAVLNANTAISLTAFGPDVICQGILIQSLSANSSADCRQGDPPLVGKQLHHLAAK